jgi:hypothetical protein
LAELEAKAAPQQKENQPALFGVPTPPADPKAAIEYVRRHSFGSGIPRLGAEVGGQTTDIAAKFLPPDVAAGIGYGANILTQALPSFLTSAKPVGVPTGSLFKVPASKLMQSAVKPSSTLPVKDVKGALNTMLEEGITPTTKGMEKAARISGQLDEIVSGAVAKSPAQVSVASIGSRLKDVHNKALRQVNPQEDLAAIRAAWDKFKTSPLIAGKTEIPVQLAHELKRGTYASLGGKSYGEVGSAAVEAQKALARGAREEVGRLVPEVEQYLARQAALMNVRDVAGTRALIEANKNPLGLAALRIGDSPMSSATFLADRWAWLKAMAALGLFQGGQPRLLAPVGIAGSIAANQPALMSP